MKSRQHRFIVSFFVILLATSRSKSQEANLETFCLHQGDRVIFYGDSITAQRYYTRDVEDFVLTRYPELSIEFFNAGVPGDTVYGGYTGDTAKRLARDVYPLKPTAITVMLGMNDPGYVPFDEHIFDVFKTGYRALIGDLSTSLPQVQLTLIASSPYDELTHGTDFPGLSKTVQKYGMFVKQFATERHDKFANFHDALDAALKTALKENPNYAALLIPDRIHPSEAAQWVMANELLRTWHASPFVSRVELDAASGVASATQNADVSQVQLTSSGITWTVLEHALPLPLPTENPMMQLTIRVANLESMDQEILQVRGLRSSLYSLQIDGKPVTDLTRDQLKHGVNLALLSTPMLDQAKGIDWLEERKTKLDTARFALEAEMPSTPGALEATTTLRSAQREITREQREKAKPKPHNFALVAAVKR